MICWRSAARVLSAVVDAVAENIYLVDIDALEVEADEE
jgi:hypothetical protein